MNLITDIFQVYPVPATYSPGTYTAPATTVTVTGTSSVFVCPFETVRIKAIFALLPNSFLTSIRLLFPVLAPLLSRPLSPQLPSQQKLLSLHQLPLYTLSLRHQYTPHQHTLHQQLQLFLSQLLQLFHLTPSQLSLPRLRNPAQPPLPRLTGSNGV
jgi:hypothetical protein